MQRLFKNIFIWIVRYLPILSLSLVAMFCFTKIFMIDIVIYYIGILAMCLLLCLSFIFKYCTYHKILILLATIFWILYEMRLLTYGILVLYLILYIILLLYGIRNKL